MNREVQPYFEHEESSEEGFGYHIVNSTVRPLFIEEDLQRGDLEGNYVLKTGVVKLIKSLRKIIVI